jgi:hypothetical protein
MSDRFGETEIVIVVDLRSLVDCCHFQDTIGVDLERDFDLRKPTRCRRDSGKFKLSQKIIILGQWTLALKYLDQHRRLIICCRGKARGR